MVDHQGDSIIPFGFNRKAPRMELTLSLRRGERPRTTDTNPHRQLTQNAPAELQELLWSRMAELPCVATGGSLVSVPGARAIAICRDCSAGPSSAFMEEREFAHIHPAHDGSLHVTLPDDIRAEALDKGWAEPHPLADRGIVPASVVMLYGPRDAQEAEIVWALVRVSHRFASGAWNGTSARRPEGAS